jgi:predicted transcriptional regulator
MAPLDPSTIRSRNDLSEFLGELARRVDSGSIEIDNPSASHFIEAAAGWTADLEGFFLNRGETVPEEPSWSLVASIFLAATVYE